jgi:hypothetical protein
MNDAGYTAFWVIIGDGYTGSLATWYAEIYGSGTGRGGHVQAVWASSAPLEVQESYKEYTYKGIIMNSNDGYGDGCPKFISMITYDLQRKLKYGT